ncbi:amidohydrolase [Ensifer sp. Root31]|nr:amidohydrolase [Ensifer sp. Root31]
MVPLADQMTRWRRHLHENPEIATQEVKTAEFVGTELDEMGIPYVGGIGGHGIVATLSRPGSKRSVGLRADMDALPITEEGDHEHVSRNHGVMHACGHDGHTASLLGAAHLLLADPGWSGIVRLIFQPAEETAVGALAMLQDGLFDRFPMDRIFAYHNWPGLEAGVVATTAGPIMAAGGRISILLRGKPGHAAMPHQSRDTLLAASHLLTALQSISARATDPFDALVVSVTTMQTGLAFNQIPGTVQLGGTMRTLSVQVRDRVEAEIHRISQGIALAFGVEAEVNIRRSVPVTINDPESANLALRAARLAGIDTIEGIRPSLAGEDFANFLNERPGAMVWIGNDMAGGARRDLHHSRYDFNDAILPVAARWFAAVARLTLDENKSLSDGQLEDHFNSEVHQ